MLVRGSGVLWHEMRVGKTRTVLHAYNQLLNRRLAAGDRPLDIVVVAPATALSVWPEEAEEMGLGLRFIRCSGTKASTRKLTPDPTGWPVWAPRCYLINPELLPHWLAWFQDNLRVEQFVLVADESHMYLRCATGQTQRFRAFEALAKGTDHAWELSGTWAGSGTGSALDVYWQLRPFGPGGDPFYFTKKACFTRPGCGKCFACRYCNAVPSAFAQTGIAYEGMKNERELLGKLPNVSVVRESDIRSIAVPDRFPVWVGELEGDWNPDVEMNNDDLDEAQRDLIPKKILLTDRYLGQLREGEVPEPEPIVVFGWHRRFTEGLARLLNAPVITGDTSQAERDRIRHEFMAGRVPVLVGNLQSMGMGIDLSAARWFLYGEPRGDAGMHFQAEARGRGPNQKAKTLRHAYLLIRRSADETTWRTRLRRGDAIERMYHAGREAGREAGGRYLEEAR